MTTQIATLTEDDEQRRDALGGRLFQSALETIELYSVYLGDRLGFYRALAEHGAATSAELATRTQTNERYAREWLEQQAVAGILSPDDASANPSQRRYSLSAGHAEVLLNQDSLSYLAPMARFAGAIAATLPALIDAYRYGGGIAWSDFGADGREAQAGMNRPMFLNQLASEWLPSVADVHARLLADPPARVADIGCGAGWSSIALARAYPRAIIDGFDLDGPSVELARANAAAYGVADRVQFHVRDAAEPSLAGSYDLVTAFECIHDVARPVDVLRSLRRLVTREGAVIVMEERVAETFEAPGDELERFFYGASILCCLPTGMAEQPSAATGTMMRPDTLRRYVREAGFRESEILPIEHPFFRFYRLVS